MAPTNPAAEIQKKIFQANMQISRLTYSIHEAKSQAPANIDIAKIHQEMNQVAREIGNVRSVAAKYPAEARQANVSADISTKMAVINRILLPEVKQLERRINPRDYEKILRTANELVKLATALTEFVKTAKR